MILAVYTGSEPRRLGLGEFKMDFRAFVDVAYLYCFLAKC